MRKLIKNGILAPIESALKPYLTDQSWSGQGRVFVISMQRTGATSTGKILTKLGFPTAGWAECARNDWPEKFYRSDFETIFQSQDFQRYQAFEYWPWFAPAMYRAVFFRYPDSRFILLERDPQDWFKSLVSHSKGRTLGLTDRHCEFYHREADLFARIDAGEAVAKKTACHWMVGKTTIPSNMRFIIARRGISLISTVPKGFSQHGLRTRISGTGWRPSWACLRRSMIST